MASSIRLAPNGQEIAYVTSDEPENKKELEKLMMRLKSATMTFWPRGGAAFSSLDSSPRKAESEAV